MSGPPHLDINRPVNCEDDCRDAKCLNHSQADEEQTSERITNERRGFQGWATCCGWRAPWWSCGGCGAWRSSSSPPPPPPLSPLWLAGGREPASGFLKLYSQDFTFSNFTFSSFHRKSLHYRQSCWFDRVLSLRSFEDIPKNNKNFPLREKLVGHQDIICTVVNFWFGPCENYKVGIWVQKQCLAG